jgi:DNA processing protein
MSLSAEPSADVAQSNAPNEAADHQAVLLDEVRLCLVPGVGPRLRQLLLERFGSARDVLAAAPSDLREVPGIGTKISRAIAEARTGPEAEELIEECRRSDLALLLPRDERYPRLLREIPDPPGVLFMRGEMLPRDGLARTMD